MTKRKVVVRISNMNSEKCRAKAMKIAVAVAGVESVALRGESRDQMVVIGERIDAVVLASSLRKSVGFTDVLSVADLQPFRDRYGALATDDNVHDGAQGRSLLAVVWRNDDSGGADYNNNYGGSGGGGGGGGGGQDGMPNYHNYHNRNNNYPYDNYYLGN